jgi:hypothetical protein
MPVQNPVSYGLGLTPLNPAQNIMQGMQVGQGLLDAREQGLQNQQAAEMRPLQMQQAQLGLRTGLAAEADANAQRAMQQAAQHSQAIAAAQKAQARQELANSVLTTDKLQKFTILYPEEAKAMEESMKRLSVEERRQFVSEAGQARAALAGGSPDVAVSFLMDRSSAREEAGDTERAAALKRLAEQARENPTLAQNMLGAFIAADDPEKFAENETKLGVQESAIREAGSKADQAASQAKITDAQAQTAFEKIAADMGLTKAQAAKYWADIQIDKRKMGLEEMKGADAGAQAERGKPLEASAVKEIGTLNASLDALDSILERKSKIDTGPVAAYANENAQVLGIDDPETTALRADLGNVVNEIINTLSGAAVSESEFARIRQGLPQFSDNDKAFKAKVIATRGRVQRALDNALKANKASGRDVSGFDGTTEDAWANLPRVQ